MFTRTILRPEGRDTYKYTLNFQKPYTVQNLIDDITTNYKNEFGHIGVKDGVFFAHTPFGNPNCEYKDGAIIAPTLPQHVLNAEIESATCTGGWGLFNYLITLK